jgi:enterochelin esterase-like enzyme
VGTFAELLDQLEDADPTMVSAHVAELRAHPEINDVGGTEAGRAAKALLEHGGMRDIQAAAELAKRAHDDGVPGAGRVLATCIDRFTFLGSRMQRFGTLTMEHQGDLLLAPLDGSIDDEVRTSLGVPLVADLRAEVDEANRARARERAAAPGLPNGLMFARVWRDPTEEELRARWAEVGEPVWADGDELTFVCDKPLAGALVGPIFELPMWRVGDLLVLTVRVGRLDEVVLTYAWWPLSPEGTPAFSRRPDPDGRFRGKNARPAAPTNDEIVGTLTDAAVESKNLGEPRKVTVYRPPGHTSAEQLPVVYATDGQFFAPYARRLDAAIENGSVPRCVVVASHAGHNRTGEYFPGFDPTTFDRHQRFFVDELARWAVDTLGVSDERAQRAVFGCSDGGAHALAVGLVHHPRFGHVIAYSSGMPPNGNERWPEGQAPYVQLCAGILEGQFHMSTSAWAYYLNVLGVERHWTERVCGHELLQWVEEFPSAVGRAFGSLPREPAEG